jgi:hypothetical protein
MARRKAPAIPDEMLDQLLSGASASTAFDQGGLLDQLKKACEFHGIVGIDSMASWASIPRDRGQRFHGMMGTDSTGSWAPG